MAFKVGDKVRLTGEAWDTEGYSTHQGDEVVITESFSDGQAWFKDEKGNDWVLGDEYTVELVESIEKPIPVIVIKRVEVLGYRLDYTVGNPEDTSISISNRGYDLVELNPQELRALSEQMNYIANEIEISVEEDK